MARHRRPAGVRDDGLAAVLAPVLETGRVEAALLIDQDSGMVLDAWSREGAGSIEVLGAAHADLARAMAAVPGAPGAAGVLSRGGQLHHLVRPVPDALGDRLVVVVVVAGGRRTADRVASLLARVPDAALRVDPPRPVPTPEWLPPAAPETPPNAPAGGHADGGPTAGEASVPVPRRGPAPPSALPAASPLTRALPTTAPPATALPTTAQPATAPLATTPLAVLPPVGP
jgi:hypothetical protein